MRAVVYARVSSLAQRESQTIESQIREVPKFISAQGWTLAAPATTYVDDGRTAKAGHLEKREAFTRLLADAARGAFDVVAVVDLDRLTRSDDLTERGAILGAFQRAGVRLAITSMGQVLDLSSSMGDMFAGLQAFFAAEENRKRRDRAKRGRALSIERGRLPSGKAPYGYSYDVPTATWLPHPEHAELVREIFRRVSSGESCRQVGYDLDARGVTPPRGGRWGHALWRIIARTTYRGRLVVDRASGRALDVPPLVDDVTWFAAQEALAKPALRGQARARHVYLCNGIAVCGLCGSRIWIHAAHSTSRNEKRAAWYICSSRRVDKNGSRCALPFHPVTDVDDRIWRAVVEFLAAPGLAARLAGRRSSGTADREAWERDGREAQRQLEQLAAAERSVLDRFTRGLLTEDGLDGQLRANASRRAMLENQARAAREALESRGRALSSLESVEAALGVLRGRLDAAAPEVRRELVRTLIPGTAGHVVTLGARGTVRARLVLDLGARCDGATDSPQNAAASQGPASKSFRVVAK